MMIGKNVNVPETVKRIKPNSVGVELGVWKGDSSQLFKSKSSKLYLVDSWSVQPYEHLESYESYLDRYASTAGIRDPKSFKKYYDDVYKSVVNRFRNDNNVIICRMDTDEFFSQFTEKVDWFYVDAAHDEDGVYKDLVNSYDHLKKFAGGTIYGDDYGNKQGVVKGVDKFLKKYNLEINNFYRNQYEIKVK